MSDRRENPYDGVVRAGGVDRPERRADAPPAPGRAYIASTLRPDQVFQTGIPASAGENNHNAGEGFLLHTHNLPRPGDRNYRSYIPLVTNQEYAVDDAMTLGGSSRPVALPAAGSYFSCPRDTFGEPLHPVFIYEIQLDGGFYDARESASLAIAQRSAASERRNRLLDRLAEVFFGQSGLWLAIGEIPSENVVGAYAITPEAIEHLGPDAGNPRWILNGEPPARTPLAGLPRIPNDRYASVHSTGSRQLLTGGPFWYNLGFPVD